MEAIDNKIEEGKEILLIGDSITKNMERFAPSYPKYFPASTVVNAGVAGDPVEAILYRVQQMNFPQSFSQTSLLCGTNNLASTSPAVMSATIIEILSALTNKCPTAFIHVFPILPRFDHCHYFVQVTYSRIFFFRFRIVFLKESFFTICRLPCATRTCTGMTKSI